MTDADTQREIDQLTASLDEMRQTVTDLWDRLNRGDIAGLDVLRFQSLHRQPGIGTNGTSRQSARADHTHVLSALPANFVFDHLHDDLGDSDDMNVDGSGVAVNYDFTVPAGRVFELARINAQFRDDAKDIPNGFFSIAELDEGLLIQILDSDETKTVLQDFDTTADPIKNHADMIALAGVDVDSDSTANKSAGGFRFTLTKSGATMRLTAGQMIRVVVQDDLTGLQEFRFMVQGILEDA